MRFQDSSTGKITDQRYMMDSLRNMSMWTAESFETSGTNGTSVVVNVQLPPRYRAFRGSRTAGYQTGHQQEEADLPSIPPKESTVPPTSVTALAKSVADSKNYDSISAAALTSTTDSRLEESTTIPSKSRILEASESHMGNTKTANVLISDIPGRPKPPVLHQTSRSPGNSQTVNFDVHKIQHRGSHQQPPSVTQLSRGQAVSWGAESRAETVSTNEVKVNKPIKSNSNKKPAQSQPKVVSRKSPMGTTSRKAEVKARLRQFLDTEKSTTTARRMKKESPRQVAKESKTTSVLRSVRVEPVSTAVTPQAKDISTRLQQKREKSPSAVASSGSARLRYNISQQEVSESIPEVSESIPEVSESIPEDASIISEEVARTISPRRLRAQSFNPRHRSILETRSSFQTLPSVTEEVGSKHQEVSLVGTYQKKVVATDRELMDSDAWKQIGEVGDEPVGTDAEEQGESMARTLEPIIIPETRKNTKTKIHVDTPIVPRCSQQRKLLPRLARKIFHCKNDNSSLAKRQPSFCSRFSPRRRMKDIIVEDAQAQKQEPELEPESDATSEESENSIVVTIEEKSVVDVDSSSEEETLETVAAFSNRHSRRRPSPLSPIDEGLTPKGTESLAVVPRSAKTASDAVRAFLWRNRATTEFCGLCTPENGFYTKEMVADTHHEKHFWD